MQNQQKKKSKNRKLWQNVIKVTKLHKKKTKTANLPKTKVTKLKKRETESRTTELLQN